MVNPTVIPKPADITQPPRDPGPSARPAANGQVVVGHIPAQRPGFQPRPALLRQLDRAGQGAPVLVLTGAPGSGKTQLAATYARARLADGGRLIAWVNARDNESLLAGLAAVADAARLAGRRSGRSAADAGQTLRHWLEADGHGCLLVFDDVEDPAVLRPFLPGGGAARVLITTAREPAAELGARVPVNVFSAEEALALLNGRTGLDDDAGAAAVAAALEHLPLGLDQAAAAIAGQDLGYAAYLAQLRTLPGEGDRSGQEKRPYPPGVAAAVLLSLVAMGAADRTGVGTGVMEVVAMLSPATVDPDLLRSAGPMGTLASGGRRVAAPQVDQALKQLEERSLLGSSLDGQAILVHHLVARVIRDRLARRGRLAVACRAAASVLGNSAEALRDGRDHAAVRELLGQVTALLDNAGDAADDADERLAWMLRRLRFITLDHLVELGDSMPRAIAIGEPLTAELERLLGPDHPDTLNARNRLAGAYRAAGRVAEAVPLFEQTLAARERLLGPDHPDTLTAQDELAAAYEDTGQVGEAILLYRMTLAAREWLLGADHPDTTRARVDLARAYREAGRMADAVPLVEQILAARERMSGVDDPSTLASRNNLATAYLATGRAAQAVPLLEQNLAACEHLLGPDHPRTQTTRQRLTLARGQAMPAGPAEERRQPDGDGDADGDAVGEGEGEGDADGLGEGDPDGLGDGDLVGLRDRDGRPEAGDDSAGGRITARE